jgi:hypothetical protein
MDATRCPKCNKRLIEEADGGGRIELRCLLRRGRHSENKGGEMGAAWRSPQAHSEAIVDDEVYNERARHIRELAAKADPFIRKRLLDLAGNYDSMVRRSPQTSATAAARINLPNVSAKE